MTAQGGYGHLPPYDATRRCQKCDSDDVSTSYHEGRVFLSEHGCAAVAILGTSYPGEHLCRCCRRCRYRWAELTEDTPRAAPSWMGQLTTAADPYEAARRAREASSAK